MIRSQDGTTIAYDITGDGPALIYVNGAIQHRAISQEATEILPLLSPKFTVITYDRRGRGESGDTQPYAVGGAVRPTGQRRPPGGGVRDVHDRGRTAFWLGRRTSSRRPRPTRSSQSSSRHDTAAPSPSGMGK
jgi:pimeloyl-ACP methyl ester carboxylesterase